MFPNKKLLQNMNDIERRRDYAEAIVQEVLTNNLACFKDLYYSHPAFENQSKNVREIENHKPWAKIKKSIWQ